MEYTDDLKNILARLKSEPSAALDRESSTPQAKHEPASEGNKWVELSGVAAGILVNDPQIQPENEHPAEDVKLFRLRKYRAMDNYDASYIALPSPRWPEPGAKMTPELWQAYHAELSLCAEANTRLRQFCDWLRHEKTHLEAFPPAKETDGLRERSDRSLLEDAEQRAAEQLAWLTGLWSARGIPIPTSEELEELAGSRTQAVSRWQ